jgi:hypothetical protein
MTLITTTQIDAILSFLDTFEAEGFRASELVSKASQMPWTNYCDDVNAFTQSLYDNGWVVPFDWGEWQGIAEQFVDNPEKLKRADLETIQKLLTTHVRKDRFCEGHLDAMFKNGHIVDLLHRLKVVRGEMKDG